MKIEAGQMPCVSLKLQSGKRVIESARAFVKAWDETKTREAAE